MQKFGGYFCVSPQSCVIQLEEEILFNVLYMSILTFGVKKLCGRGGGAHCPPALPLATALVKSGNFVLFRLRNPGRYNANCDRA